MADPDALVRNLYLADAGLWVLLYLLLAWLAYVRMRHARSGRVLGLGFFLLALRIIIQTVLNRLVLPAATPSAPLLAALELTFGIAGFLLGSTHEDTAIAGVIPNAWISWLVGGNSVFSNLFASIVGAFMYFATLTEVPILQGLLASGMGKGPALALLLAGPSLSLPNMLVIRGVIGTQKTVVYVSLVIVLSTIAGLVYGAIV